jgi:hypothetical protein
MHKDIPKDRKEEPMSLDGDNVALPQYYDSEPSAQPPGYVKERSLPGTNTQSRDKQSSSSGGYQYGEPAARVYAVCAMPTSPPDEQKIKRSWRERWKDWSARKHQEKEPVLRHTYVRRDFGTGTVPDPTQWNVMGGDIGHQKSQHTRKKK